MRRRGVLVVFVLAIGAPFGAAGSASADGATPPLVDGPPTADGSPPTDAPLVTEPGLDASTTVLPASQTIQSPPAPLPPATGSTVTTAPPATGSTVTTVPPSTGSTVTTAPPATTSTAPPVTTVAVVGTIPAAPAPQAHGAPADDRAAPASPARGTGDRRAAPPERPVAPPSTVAVPAGPNDHDLVRPITFPVAGPITYVDDYGTCRDACRRSHRGNDLIGDRLQPLLAMHDGVIDHLVHHATAGHGFVIRDAEGWQYRTYHVNNDTPGTDDRRDDGTWRFVDGIVPGARVHAGQLLGWMGDSGNSEGSVPHAHVEIHTPSGQAINPYWSLRRAQQDVNCRIMTIDADATSPTDPTWLARGWEAAALPTGWIPLRLTAGRPRSGEVAARMWISPHGFTPVDAAALRVGDARYDDPGACASADAGGRADVTVPTELDVILAAIRAVESGGDYTAEARTSSASGAYQFIDSSWGGYAGYARARHAPPAVQDARAAEWASAILARNGGDVSAVPVSWYLGHVPVGREWDTVPPGNVITPRQYQRRWMATYTGLLGQPGAPVAATRTTRWQPIDTSATCHTILIATGPIDDPQVVLTQAQSFLAESTGRAVPATTDPCDPARAQSQRTPSDATTAVDRSHRSVGRRTVHAW